MISITRKYLNMILLCIELYTISSAPTAKVTKIILEAVAVVVICDYKKKFKIVKEEGIIMRKT